MIEYVIISCGTGFNRMHLEKLQLPVDGGFLGCLSCCFIITPLVTFSSVGITPSEGPSWYKMEQVIGSRLPLLNCLSTKLSPRYRSHPVISHLQGTWRVICQMFNLNPNLKAAVYSSYAPPCSVTQSNSLFLACFWSLLIGLLLFTCLCPVVVFSLLGCSVLVYKSTIASASISFRQSS